MNQSIKNIWQILSESFWEEGTESREAQLSDWRTTTECSTSFPCQLDGHICMPSSPPAVTPSCCRVLRNCYLQFEPFWSLNKFHVIPLVFLVLVTFSIWCTFNWKIYLSHCFTTHPFIHSPSQFHKWCWAILHIH